VLPTTPNRYDSDNDRERAMSEAKQPPSGSHQIAIQDAKARLLENGGYESATTSPKGIPSSCRRAPSTSSSATSN
jgi:hypothetical protein